MHYNTRLGRCAFHLGSWSLQRCRYNHTSAVEPVAHLPDATLSTFRTHAFAPGIPHLLPPGTFSSLPAISKWFNPDHPPTLNKPYLSPYASTLVPLELTHKGSFTLIHAPLEHLLSHTPSPSSPAIYLAQCPLPDLPAPLQADLPEPALVRAGKGDVYATSLWLGQAPTYTPLHRDPNPNLFVQLAGRKRVRLCAPDMGRGVFARVQRAIGGSGREGMRGMEMMEGRERAELEKAVWGDGWAGLECEVSAGDGLFVPLGWWHSVKGVGEGITGSVNWWFR